MDCIAWEGSYTAVRDVNGRDVRQQVYEYIIGTEHGQVHFKHVVNPSGSTRLFMDLDASAKIDVKRQSESREKMKRHQQFGMTQRAVSRAGGTFNSAPFGTIEDFQKGRPSLMTAIRFDERASNAWKAITGLDDTPRFDDLITAAQEVQQSQNDTYLQKKAVAMAEVDPTWGSW